MRLVMKLLAPLLFWVAYGLFRSPIGRRSKRCHDGIMKLFRIAAESGHKRALSVYGHLLHFRGEDSASRIQGALYLQRAAEQGEPKALYQMGRIHEQGYEHHFAVDEAKALDAYRRAAEAGHPLAIKRMLELCRDGGLGMAPDDAQLRHWQARQHRPASD